MPSSICPVIESADATEPEPAPGPLDAGQLVRQCQAGSREAFALLVGQGNKCRLEVVCFSLLQQTKRAALGNKLAIPNKQQLIATGRLVHNVAGD